MIGNETPYGRGANVVKLYVVCWVENNIVKSKAYKNKKSAEKFGIKKMCSYDIALYIDGIRIEYENQSGGESNLRRK